MNFPSSRLLRSSPLVPSRALFRLPSSFFFPPPSCFRFHAYQHKPLGRSTPLHRSSKFFLFIEGRRLAGPSNLETTIFSSPPFSSSSFFLLLLLQNRTDGRAFPPRLSASCAPGSRAPSSIDETATRYVEISSSSSSPLSRRSRAGATRIASSLPPLHLAALTPTGARCYVSRSARIVIPSSTFICDYCWNVTDRLVLIMGHHRFPLCFRGRWKEITTPFDSV